MTQMANCGIMIDMEHNKHQLQQIEASKSDNSKLEVLLLSAKEMTRDRSVLGSIGFPVDHCCAQLSCDLSERRRRQNDATIQEMLKLNKMRRSAKSVECKLKIRSVPIIHTRLMEVHDGAHANVEGRASQEAHVILAVHKNVTEQKVPVSSLSWSSKEVKRVVRSRLSAETSSMATCTEQLDLMRTLWSQMTTAEFSLDDYEGALKKPPTLLVTDCKSLYDAIHKEGADPSTDKRLSIAIVNSRATEGEAGLRWIDARCQTADLQRKRCWRHDGKRERERGQDGFIKTRVRAEYAEAIFLERRNTNTEVRTMPHLPSA